MRRYVKVCGFQQLDRLRDQRVIEDDRAENGEFGFRAAGKRAFKNRVANRFRRSHVFVKPRAIRSKQERQRLYIWSNLNALSSDLFFSVKLCFVLFRINVTCSKLTL